MGVPSIEDGMIELPIGKQPGTGGEKMHVDEAEGMPSRMVLALAQDRNAERRRFTPGPSPADC